MSDDFQEMILRVVEYQRFERVQGTETIEVDVQDPRRDQRRHGRADGARRRSDATSTTGSRSRSSRVPPLRERAEDIPALVEYFLEELQREVPSIGRKVQPLGAREAAGVLLARKHPPVEKRRRAARPRNPRRRDRRGPARPRRPRLARSRARRFPRRWTISKRLSSSEALSRGEGQPARRRARSLGVTYDQFRHYYRKFGLKTDIITRGPYGEKGRGPHAANPRSCELVSTASGP